MPGHAGPSIMGCAGCWGKPVPSRSSQLSRGALPHLLYQFGGCSLSHTACRQMQAQNNFFQQGIDPLQM